MSYVFSFGLSYVVNLIIHVQELLPDPTPEEIAREAEHEAAIFAQAANIDRLLSMLRGLDPARDNLADNEEIQVRKNSILRPMASD